MGRKMKYKNTLLPTLCMCLCIHMCNAGSYICARVCVVVIHVHLCLWRTEIYLVCHSLGDIQLLLRQCISLGLEDADYVKLKLSVLSQLLSTSSVLGLLVCPTELNFYVGVKDCPHVCTSTLQTDLSPQSKKLFLINKKNKMTTNTKSVLDS